MHYAARGDGRPTMSTRRAQLRLQGLDAFITFVQGRRRAFSSASQQDRHHRDERLSCEGADDAIDISPNTFGTSLRRG